jgi:TatD DNase family protein
MPIIDTHAHLYLKEFSHDVDKVIEQARLHRIEKILLPDLDMSSRPHMMRLYERYPSFFSIMAGLHPTSVKQNYKEELKKLDEFLQSGAFFCGIGEIGIDLYWDDSFKNEQIEVFEYQLNVAAERKLPLSIHQRNSIQLVMSILKKYAGKVTGVLHCFSGNEKDAKEAIDLGFYLGIGGVVTYKNSSMAEVVKAVGCEYLLLETDAPYLPPVPHRGQRNEPAYLTLVLNRIASLVGKDPWLVEEIIYVNTKKLFSHV